MSAEIAVDPQTDKRLDLVRRYTKAIIEERIPPGKTPTDALLFLLPDDDPAYVEREIALGAEIARNGQDVYYRHIRVEDLPE
jgi:hypothetical protein